MEDDTVVLDLGIGNVANVRKVTGGTVSTDIGEAGKIVLPGVGNFKGVMEALEPQREALLDAVEEGRYVLGICLGMQLLFHSSQEGEGKGLGIMEGEVKRFVGVRTPHIGWNRVRFEKDCPLFKGIPDGSHFYFVHSYHVSTGDDMVAGSTLYGEEDTGVRFPSVVWDGNVFGVQFHPEKSSVHGLRLLKNFRELST